ncbi:MAG: tetratricopeptide repeat protein [Pyrinomonadaceae bacterium]
MLKVSFGTLLLLLIFSFISLAPAQGQDIIPANSLEITGQLRFANGQAPAERVLIRLSSFGGGLVDQTTSDSRGNFRFYGMRRGRYIISIYNPNYSVEPQQADVDERLVRRAYVFLQLIPTSAVKTAPNLLDADRLLDARVPTGAQKEYERGRSAYNDKKTEKAITALEKAISLHPEFLAAQVLLGMAYMEVQQWDQAEQSFTHALRIKPEMVIVLIDLGEVHRRQKRYKDAEKALQAVLKLNDDVWQGHYTLARVYWETNDLAGAGKHTAHTLRLNPALAEAHLLAGNIFVRAARPENALVEYEEYLRLAPKGEFASLTRKNVEKLKKVLTDKNR